jgi:hypothetical protein
MKELIRGNLDQDFILDVDITSASKPDFPVIRKQILEGATFAAQIEPKINQEGNKIEWSKMVKDFFATFDTIPDAEQYLSQMSEQERLQFQNLLAQTQANLQAGAGKSTPSESQIQAQALKTPSPTAGQVV